MKTKQIDFWEGTFGKEYTDRNSASFEDWNQSTQPLYGVTKHAINESLLASVPRTAKILEVGCNIGRQLESYQKLGFEHLYGVELQHYAVEKAKARTQHINIIQGSGFDLPFRDNYFDLVCTNGVLIHIAPKDLPLIMSEMYRCSKQYISGFEYYAEEETAVTYRNNEGYLWKMDYAQVFQQHFPNLELMQQTFYPYLNNAEQGNKDYAYLLQQS